MENQTAGLGAASLTRRWGRYGAEWLLEWGSRPTRTRLFYDEPTAEEIAEVIGRRPGAGFASGDYVIIHREGRAAA